MKNNEHSTNIKPNSNDNYSIMSEGSRETLINPVSILDEVDTFKLPNQVPDKNQIQNLINSLNSLSISSLNGDKKLYDEISDKLDSINKLLSKNTSSNSANHSNIPVTSAIDNLNSILNYVTTINALKNQLNELPFNTFEKVYVENCLTPVLTVFYQLSIAAASFKDTAQSLSLSTTTKRKTHKIKEYEKTTYDIMDQIQCLYEILENRIHDFIKILCNCK